MYSVKLFFTQFDDFSAFKHNLKASFAIEILQS